MNEEWKNMPITQQDIVASPKKKSNSLILWKTDFRVQGLWVNVFCNSKSPQAQRHQIHREARRWGSVRRKPVEEKVLDVSLTDRCGSEAMEKGRNNVLMAGLCKNSSVQPHFPQTLLSGSQRREEDELKPFPEIVSPLSHFVPTTPGLCLLFFSLWGGLTKRDGCEAAPGNPGNYNKGIAW